MSALHNIIVAFGDVFLLSMIVVFIGGVFKTRNQTWTTVFIMTGVTLFVPGLMMGARLLLLSSSSYASRQLTD
ncbi:MAG: hypothetical protein HRU20_32315 [Pseudomonadales bacterium]|nr:hypothetical protein [Pseudomonadales bacterium]